MLRRADALAALRSRLVGQVIGGETIVSVTDGGADGFLVEVRRAARLVTHTVVIAADDDSLATDHLFGEPAEMDAGSWAGSVALSLTEGLETGLLSWGVRTELRGGGTAIDPTLEPEHTARRSWGVVGVPLTREVLGRWASLRLMLAARGRGSVVVMGGPRGRQTPDPRPGERIEVAGLDVGPGRRAVAQGCLAVWLEATAWDEMDLPVRALGQAVAVRVSDDTARLEHVEVVDDGPPPDVLAELVAGAAHAAADVGFHWLEVDAEVPVTDGLAVVDADPRRRLDLTTLR